MRRIMIDIETLDTKSSSVILSIGAVEFDEREIGRTFHQFISIGSCLKYGLTVDGNTLSWWMEQPDNAREIFQRPGLPLEAVLVDLFQAFEWAHIDEVWANGTDFDLPIIANACRAIGLDNPPWPYYKARDYRTVRKMYASEVLNELTVEPTVEHDALADAIAQARTLQALMASGAPIRGFA